MNDDADSPDVTVMEDEELNLEELMRQKAMLQACLGFRTDIEEYGEVRCDSLGRDITNADGICLSNAPTTFAITTKCTVVDVGDDDEMPGDAAATLATSKHVNKINNKKRISNEFDVILLDDSSSGQHTPDLKRPLADNNNSNGNRSTPTTTASKNNIQMSPKCSCSGSNDRSSSRAHEPERKQSREQARQKERHEDNRMKEDLRDEINRNKQREQDSSRERDRKLRDDRLRQRDREHGRINEREKDRDRVRDRVERKERERRQTSPARHRSHSRSRTDTLRHRREREAEREYGMRNDNNKHNERQTQYVERRSRDTATESKRKQRSSSSDEDDDLDIDIKDDDDDNEEKIIEMRRRRREELLKKLKVEPKPTDVDVIPVTAIKQEAITVSRKRGSKSDIHSESESITQHNDLKLLKNKNAIISSDGKSNSNNDILPINNKDNKEREKRPEWDMFADMDVDSNFEVSQKRFFWLPVTVHDSE